MANALAIATVTAALEGTLQAAANKTGEEVTIHVGRPNGEDVTKPTVGLFLYRVVPNPALRNQRQPVRARNGSPIEKPASILDLHYLISVYGDESKFVPERLLGEIVRELETRPVFTAKRFEGVIGSNDSVASSDLHREPEPVRATPVALDLEELSKLWSIFFQVPYALSVAYQLSYVVVEAEEDAASGPPVTLRTVTALPLSKVRIHTVRSAGGPAVPVTWGSTLEIVGSGLAKPGLRLRIAGLDVAMGETEIADERIRVPLRAQSFGNVEIPAGLHRVQAFDPPPAGAPAHLERGSDVVPFSLRPELVSVTPQEVTGATLKAGKLEVRFKPDIANGQEVRLLLDERAAPPAPASPQSYVLQPEAPNAFPAAVLAFPFADVKSAAYLVRAQVDGVYSAPHVGTDATQPSFGQIVGPLADLS